MASASLRGVGLRFVLFVWLLALCTGGLVLANDLQVTFVPAAGPDGEDLLVLDLPSVHWEHVPGAVSPTMQGFGRMAQVAAPDLLARIERVALPAGGGFEIVDIRVNWSDGVIPGLLAAYPAHDPDRPDLAPEFLEDLGYWPVRAVRLLTDRGAFRTLSFASLEIRPLQVDLTAGRFRVARRIEILLRRPGSLSKASRSSSLTGALENSFGPSLAHGTATIGSGWATDVKDAAELDANPSTFPAWNFDISEKGLHRISFAWASAHDPDLLSFLTANDPRQFRMIVQGVEIPIFVDGEDDGAFDGPGGARPDGDSIVFYGQPLLQDIMSPDVWQSGDFTDENVYRLDISPGPQRIVDQAGNPGSGYIVPPSFYETSLVDPPLRFQGFVPENGVDHWYYYPWLNTLVPVDRVDLFLETPGHIGGDVSLRSRLMGFKYNNNLHRTEILVDDLLVDGCGDGDNGCVDWDGHIEFTHGEDQGPVVFTRTLAASTKVTIGTPLGRGASYDQVAVNWVELSYDRAYAGIADHLLFTGENGPREFHLDDFSQDPMIWEISANQVSEAGMEIVIPRRIAGAEFVTGQARFQIENDAALPATRMFAATTMGGALIPRRAHEDLPPSSVDSLFGDSLKAGGLGADWLVIGHRSLLIDEGSASLGPELSALMAHRGDPGLQNLATAVVDIQDIYDEFSWGIEDPEALRSFLSHVLGGGAGSCSPNWSPAPSYVILLGDASWDHKNNYGYDPDRELVPVYMFDVAANSQFGHYPSDTWFAAVCGEDEFPDLSIGRIPAHTFAQAEGVFRKIRQHELTTEPSSVTGKALLISEFESVNHDFFRVHDEIYEQWFTGTPQTAQKLYEAGFAQADAENLNTDIDTAVNAGAGIVSYIGHGGYKDWGNGNDIFKTEDPFTIDKDDQEDWNPGTHAMFTVHANCITGNFAATASQSSTNNPWYSFLEDTLLTPEKSMVAGMAPSHLTDIFELDQILDPVYEELFSRTKTRLLASIELRMRESFHSLNNMVNLRSFILQGDPATILAIPAPKKPTITGVGKEGSGELRISWSVESDPEIDRFRIYRSRSPSGGYVVAGETADSSAVDFLDTGMENCREQFYYVVSVDADGYESRWSNFNETCYGSRVDCWSGTPENPNPPSTPTLVSVEDTERGGQLRVTWQAVPDGDLVRYHIKYGSQTGVYTHERQAGPSETSTTISGLVDGQPTFVVVHAAHCSTMGDASNELSGVPHTVKGINPPGAISDLTLTRPNATDLRLNWSNPGETVWGTGVSISAIEVYGSDTAPGFPVDPAHRLVSLPGSATSWDHLGQGTSVAREWYYVVVAVDGSDLPSAAGAGYPAAVDDLLLFKMAGNQVRLVWTRVSQASTGERLHIVRYNVYGRSSVLPRTDTGAGTLLTQVAEPGAGSSERRTDMAMPPESFFTYQVLAEETHGNESIW